MPEKHVEQALVNRIKAMGGIAFKFTSPGRRSVPDRLCLLPGGRVIFVECKAPGKRPTELQAREHARLRSLGFDVRVIDNKEAANALT
jgi:tRNA U54 and U55 pseudouridine synthase Pus10